MMQTIDFNKSIQIATHPLPGSIAKSFTYSLAVKKKFVGFPIVDFLLIAIPQSNPQTWLDKIASKNLKIDNKPITATYQVKPGEIVTHTSEPRIEPIVNTKISLIYADDAIWVIDKPSPLPVHASGRFIRNTLISILEIAFPNCEFKLTHRIDANTTGLIVIAKNKFSANNISQQFENKTVKKEYIALVDGIVTENSLNLIQSIGTEVLIGGARKIDINGKLAQTEIEVLERRLNKNQTLLKVTPFTGRTNQIRLHLAELGHPIVGDIGHRDINYFIENPFTYIDDSLFLHAHQLTLIHPISKKEITFTAPIPTKFKEK